MATVELFDSHSLSASLGNQKAAVRSFKVDLPVDQAMALISGNITIPGVPKRGESHPYLPGLYCQTHDVTDFGTGINSLIRAMYGTSNVARWQYAEPDITGNLFVKGISFQRVTVQIPFAVLVPYTYSAGSQQQNKDGWIAKSKPLAETRMVFDCRWRIPNPNLNTLEIFGDQDNKIHTINGRRYLFNVGSVTAIDNTWSEVSAQWTLDTGTLIPFSWSGTAKIRLPKSLDPAFKMPFEGFEPLPDYLRDPYTRLVTVSSTDPDGTGEAAVPRCRIVGDYAEEPDGWNLLPNVPNL